MKKRHLVLAAAVLAGGFTFSTAGAASAAHCADKGGPGASDYATHAQNEGHPGSEGQWHRGYSSCVEQSQNFGFQGTAP